MDTGDGAAAAAHRIEAAFAAAGLRVTLRGTLRSYPGSIHWHLKRGRDAGTLEVTFWPRQRRLWLTIHEGRGAPWMDEAGARLQAAIAGVIESGE